jgi:aspartate ammonia-lyase
MLTTIYRTVHSSGQYSSISVSHHENLTQCTNHSFMLGTHLTLHVGHNLLKSLEN